jgi:hypothetical protein
MLNQPLPAVERRPALLAELGEALAAAWSRRLERPCRCAGATLEGQLLVVQLEGLLSEREAALAQLPAGRPALRRWLDDALHDVYPALAHDVEERLCAPIAECHMEPAADGLSVSCRLRLQSYPFPALPVRQPA